MLDTPPIQVPTTTEYTNFNEIDLGNICVKTINEAYKGLYIQLDHNNCPNPNAYCMRQLTYHGSDAADTNDRPYVV